MGHLVGRRIDAFQTAHVYRRAFIGRDVGRASAGLAEVMLVFSGAKSIGADVGLRGLQMQLVVADKPMEIAVLAANRAVAIGERIDVAFDLERDFSAVASALMTHREPPDLANFTT